MSATLPHFIRAIGSNAIVRFEGSKGRGIIAVRSYRPGRLIEEAPVFVFPRKEIDQYGKLSHYVYEWGRTKYAIAFGQASIYNHSFEPNARYFMDYKNGVIKYYACKFIKPGDEITTNYLGHPKARGQMTFEVK